MSVNPEHQPSFSFPIPTKPRRTTPAPHDDHDDADLPQFGCLGLVLPLFLLG